MKLTKNFKLSEFSYSNTAVRYIIPNFPPTAVVNNIKLLCEHILQPIRDKVSKPVKISSGYRSPKVNELCGGVPNSQHMSGQAADIYIDGMTPYEIAKLVLNMKLPFDQLILYPTFVHISYSERHRRQLLYDKSYKGERLE